jgi:protein-S-isoprenylcysteine O-methyltransferase Ste14
MTFSWDVLYTITVWGCWGIFCLMWAAGALYNVRHAPPAEQRRDGLNAWLVGIVLIVAARTLIPPQVLAALTFDALPLRVIGVALLLVSTLFTLWARLSLGLMWTSSAVIKRDHQMRTAGPYAVTRHPIYTGVLGMLVGTMLMSGLGVWIAYVIVGAAVLATKAAAEERLLVEQFGDRYRVYQGRVTALVPGLGRLHPGHWRTRPSSGVS